MTVTTYSRRASNLLINRQLMTTGRVSGTHLDRTVNSKRSEVCSEAIVVGIDQLSPTVKGYRLKVLNREVTFKPGQWVDMTIPDIDTVGGFSMCSTPLALRTEGILELAVKQSDHPPAQWMHGDCRVSSCLQLRVGGDFVYDPDPGGPITNLLLVAGGVGINPLLAMLKHHAELLDSGHWSSAVSPPKAYLLYSAKETDELVFKKEIDQLILTHCNLVRGKYFLTQEEPKVKSPSIKQGRIGKPDLLEGLDFLGREQTDCYLCGPPPLIDSVRSNLIDAGISEQQIQFEKWW